RTQLTARASVTVTLSVAAALARVEPKNPDVLKVVREYAETPSGSTAAQALDVLGTMRAGATDALPGIQAQLKSNGPVVRLRPAEALWRVSGKPDEAVPVLAALLSQQTQPGIRGGGVPATRSGIATMAAQALGEIGRLAVTALPELRKCQTDPD